MKQKRCVFVWFGVCGCVRVLRHRGMVHHHHAQMYLHLPNAAKEVRVQFGVWGCVCCVIEGWCTITVLKPTSTLPNLVI